MKTNHLYRLHFLVLLLVISFAPATRAVFLHTNDVVLSSTGQLEWDEFASRRRGVSRLELRFQSKANGADNSLLIRQEDVRHEWDVSLNGTKLGRLLQVDQSAVHALAIPAKRLRDGENVLTIDPPKEAEQIVIRSVEVVAEPLATLLSQARAEVVVTENGQPIPCRITIANPEGELEPFITEATPTIAGRTGVLYTSNGRAHFGLRAGRHIIYVGRGPEYGVSTNDVTIPAGESRAVTVELTRQVDTRGWVALDTHIHTVTHSRHGDATLAERLVTIAGEGIELAAATDHNFLADYKPAMRASAVEPHFTPMIGNEVTTRRGHFNIFPVTADSRVPDFRLEDWRRLFPALRATPGVQVVIMNHPTDIHAGFRPFAGTNFNSVTGENLHGNEYGMDGIELINSAALQSDQTQVFSNWFALLNAGRRLVGVGSSDSHEVARFAVGQGRTWVRAPDAAPQDIPVLIACSNLLAGRNVASLGLFLDAIVNERWTFGDLAREIPKELTIRVAVQGAEWATANEVALYANGKKVASQMLPTPHGKGEKGRMTFIMPKPAHDVWLVPIATGNAETAPFWAIPKPYQATGTAWQPRLYAVGNPIWIDADGDGRFTSAREYAERIMATASNDPQRAVAAASGYDEVVASHLASFLTKAGVNLRDVTVDAPAHVQHGFRAYSESIKMR